MMNMTKFQLALDQNNEDAIKGGLLELIQTIKPDAAKGMILHLLSVMDMEGLRKLSVFKGGEPIDRAAAASIEWSAAWMDITRLN